MYAFSETVRIDRPAAEAWAMLIDFPNVPAWEDGVLEVRQTSPGQPGVGTTFIARRVFGWRETFIDCRITAWEADRLVTMELIGGMVRRASVTYVVEPIDDTACRIRYTTDGEMRSLLAWTTPLIPTVGRRLIRSNLATLERLLKEAAPAGRTTTSRD
jgi:hypothetical protein